MLCSGVLLTVLLSSARAFIFVWSRLGRSASTDSFVNEVDMPENPTVKTRRYVLYMVHPKLEPSGFRDDYTRLFRDAKQALSYGRYLCKHKNFKAALVTKETTEIMMGKTPLDTRYRTMIGVRTITVHPTKKVKK